MTKDLASYLRGVDHSLMLHEAAGQLQKDQPELSVDLEDMIATYSPDTTISELLPMAIAEGQKPVTLKGVWRGIRNCW